jgi:Ca2+-binding EF-hand superfamily protein
MTGLRMRQARVLSLAPKSEDAPADADATFQPFQRDNTGAITREDMIKYAAALALGVGFSTAKNYFVRQK